MRARTHQSPFRWRVKSRTLPRSGTCSSLPPDLSRDKSRHCLDGRACHPAAPRARRSSGQRSTGPLLFPHHPPAGAFPRPPGRLRPDSRTLGRVDDPTLPDPCRPGVRRINRSTGAIDRARARHHVGDHHRARAGPCPCQPLFAERGPDIRRPVIGDGDLDAVEIGAALCRLGTERGRSGSARRPG